MSSEKIDDNPSAIQTASVNITDSADYSVEITKSYSTKDERAENADTTMPSSDVDSKTIQTAPASNSDVALFDPELPSNYVETRLARIRESCRKNSEPPQEKVSDWIRWSRAENLEAQPSIYKNPELVDLKVLLLHKNPKYMEEVCQFLEKEWCVGYSIRMSQLRRSTDRRPSIILLNENVVIGHGKVSEYRSRCFIESVLIHKDWRRKTIGTFLMKNLEKYCNDVLGFNKIKLHTIHHTAFYTKLGYQELVFKCRAKSDLGANCKTCEARFADPQRKKPMFKDFV